MSYNEENLEKRRPGTKSYRELMDQALTFNATEYGVYMGINLQSSKRELTELVLSGKAEVIHKRGTSVTYRLKPPSFQTNDPFKLIKRKDAAEQLDDWTKDKWMYGAQIS